MVKLEKIMIKNYKCLENTSIDLNLTSLLLGKNNNGKSSILEAIELAFTYSTIEKEDVFQSLAKPFDKNKKVSIDVLIYPCNDEGGIDKFEDDWGLFLGMNISSNINAQEFFAYRTELEYDDDRQVYINQKKLITEWKDDGNHTYGNSISRLLLNSFDVFYISAQRDLSNDIKDKRSLWYKLTSNVSIKDTDKEEINNQINILNEKIISNNPILKDVSENLKVTNSNEKSEISIAPITNDISNIYKGMNVYYKNNFNNPISIEKLGLGIRNWAVFSVLEAYVKTKRKKMLESDKPYFPILLIEEPESHVHPQQQRHMFKNVNKIYGQKIITTHSPFILSQIKLQDIFFVYKSNGETNVRCIIDENIVKNEQELQMLNRVVMNTYGELFFSNGVILVEGITDVESIKMFFKAYFGVETFELGFDIVCVNGGNYKPFIKILEALKINWFIFSDGEPEALRTLKSILKNLFNNQNINDYNNIVYIPNNMCLEEYLLSENYAEEIKIALNKVENRNNYIQYYIRGHHGQPRKKKNGVQEIRNYKGSDGEKLALKDAMIENKTKYIIEITNQIVQKKENNVPNLIKKIITKLYKTGEGDE